MRGINNGIVVSRLFARDDLVNFATNLDHSVTEPTKNNVKKGQKLARGEHAQSKDNEPVNVSHSFRFSRLNLGFRVESVSVHTNELMKVRTSIAVERGQLQVGG